MLPKPKEQDQNSVEAVGSVRPGMTLDCVLCTQVWLTVTTCNAIGL